MENILRCQEAAAKIYRLFCESEVPSQLGGVWHDFEDDHGPVEQGSAAENLVLAAMSYALEKMEVFTDPEAPPKDSPAQTADDIDF